MSEQQNAMQNEKSKTSFWRSRGWLLPLFMLLLGLDQWSKQLAVQHLQPVGEMPFLPGFLGFRYVQNTGAAFGLFQGKPQFLLIFTGIALLFVTYYLFAGKDLNLPERLALVMILAGGFANNFLDRLRLGYVVDFLEFQFISFPVFNVADIFVTCGAALFLISALVTSKKQPPPKEQEPPKETL